MLQSMGSQIVGQDSMTELNRIDSDWCEVISHCSFDSHFSNELTHLKRP